jgi:hypothetical protein
LFEIIENKKHSLSETVRMEKYFARNFLKLVNKFCTVLLIEVFGKSV